MKLNITLDFQEVVLGSDIMENYGSIEQVESDIEDTFQEAVEQAAAEMVDIWFGPVGEGENEVHTTITIESERGP